MIPLPSGRTIGLMTVLGVLSCGTDLPPHADIPTDPGPTFDRVVMSRIVSGAWHSCAISGVGSGVPNGTVYCWGRNDHGQLGTGSASIGDYRPNPQRVVNPATGTGFGPGSGAQLRFFRLAVGDGYSCGLAEGRLWCWGADPIGRGSSRPVFIEGDLGLRTLAGGDRHACALDGGGDLYCFGDNRRGQLGVGTRVESANPLPVPGVAFSVVTAGGAHTCALTDRGEAYCWGANDYGQVGTGNPGADVLTPAPVTGGFRFAEISAGAQHTCGITQSGQTRCWGNNEVAQLGTAAPLPYSGAPVPVDGPHRFGTLAAGHHHTCAATPAKVVYCWGLNDAGQIGTDLALGATQVGPDSVHTDLPFRELAAGRYHVCSTSKDLGYCWGGNAFGQVGNGSTVPNLVPGRVIGPP